MYLEPGIEQKLPDSTWGIIVPNINYTPCISMDLLTQNCGIAAFKKFFRNNVLIFKTQESAHRNRNGWVEGQELFIGNRLETDDEYKERVDVKIKQLMKQLKANYAKALVIVSLNEGEYRVLDFVFRKHKFVQVYEGVNPNSRNNIRVYHHYISPNLMVSDEKAKNSKN